MARSRGAWVWSSVVAAALPWPAEALAQLPIAQPATAAERHFSLDYRAPAGCPPAATLALAVQARTQDAALVAPEAAAVRLTVELGPDGASTLWVDLPEGSFRRAFRAECAEAVATIAVIASMVLEAEPMTRRAMAETPAAFPLEPASAAPAPSTPPQDEPEATPPEPEPAAPEPESLPRPRRQESRSTRSTPGRARAKVRWGVSAGGALETAVAPSSAFGGVLGFEAWSDRPGYWAPGVHVSLLATLNATEVSVNGTGKFRLVAGRLQFCPFRLPLNRTLRVLPCALFEAGSLTAEGGPPAVNIATKSMPWFAGGLSLGAELDLSKSVALEAAGAGKLLARHDEFVFNPSHPFYDVPWWSFGFGVGLLLRFG